MDIYQTIKADPRAAINKSTEHGITVFHAAFQNPNDAVLVTVGGNRQSAEAYENALHGSEVYEQLHAHDCFFLVYVIRGTNLEIIEEQRLEMAENDLLMITPYTLHHNFYYGESEVIFIHLQTKILFDLLISALSANIMFSDFFSDFLANQHVKKALYFKDCSKSVHGIISTILQEYIASEPLYQTKISFLVGGLIIELARTQKPPAQFLHARSDEQIKQILAYITDHYQDITLKSTAVHFGYNPSYLSRRIKEYTGKSFIQLLTSYRLNRAVILIRQQQLTIENIAEACGYRDLSTFYKAFKKQFHCRPRDIASFYSEHDVSLRAGN